MLPIIAISMGDPLGVGPETIVKALSDPALRGRARFRIIGSASVLTRAAVNAGVETTWLSVPRGAPIPHGAESDDVLVLDDPTGDPGAAVVPQPTRAGGEASFRFVEDAIAAAQLPPGHPDHSEAIVTAPISKTSWELAGHGPHSPAGFPGHTELLAARFNARRVGMLFVGPALRVILATVHVPLMDVRRLLTAERVSDAIDLGHASCRQLGIEQPRIAVCGLNPHAGEGGLLGEEDDLVIAPAVRRAGDRGIDAAGPFPADTLFAIAAAPPFGRGRYDLVVAMYHDQGLIPVKLVDGFKTVNVTVGLPAIRTSPAHGTAFDIAGRNQADPASMRAAIELAIDMAAAKRAAPRA